MTDPRFRIDELQKLVEIARKLYLSRSVYRPTTERAYLAEQVFGKILLHCISFLRLWPQNKQDIYNNLDAASLAGVARSIIEAYHVFNYLCELRLSKEEFEFRVALMGYHHAADLDRILSQFQFDSSDRVRQTFNMASAQSKHMLDSNSIFHGLTQGEQKEILKGKKAYQWNLSSRTAPLSKDIEEGIYRLLSNCVHSFPLGLMNYTFSAPDNHLNLLGVIFLALESTLLYNASVTTSYIRLRWKLGKRLTKEEKRFVSSLITPKYIEEWLAARRKFGASLF